MLLAAIDNATATIIAAIVLSVGQAAATIEARRSRRAAERAVMEAQRVARENAAAAAAIRHEVTTANGQTMAAIVDLGETRRIEEIPLGERTATEQGHIEATERDES